jgi:ribitol 2-dehydrogenase
MSEVIAGGVALVTGSSSGIGLATARELSRQGMRVVLTARSAERLEQVRAEMPGPSCVVPADIAAPGAAARAVEAAVSTFGALDVVVANAGVYLGGQLWDSGSEAIARLVATNVNGVMQTVRAALDVMLTKRSGDIVVTGSVSGYQAIPWEPVYSASKHALRAFVDGVRRQLAGTGVRMGEVAPGAVHTDLWSAAGEPGFEDLAGKTSGISPQDVADAVVFMLTRPRHVTVRDLVILPSDQAI